MKDVRIRILYILCAAVLLSACFKDVSYDTNYILKPLSQASSNETAQPLEGVLAYAYGVDTTQWTVATYSDALAGIVTMKEDPSQRLSLPDAQASPYEQEGTTGWLTMPLKSERQMVVVVDPLSRLYAYTQQKLGQNLPNLYVSIVFKPWKEGFSYKDGNWSFYNEFYTPPAIIDCLIEPKTQAAEGGNLLPVTVKAYAYAADTTAWYIASYEDAERGVITSRTGLPQRTNPTATAYKEPDSDRYKMRISDTPLMIVVVDQTARIYAYTQLEADLHGEAVTLPLTFRPWRETWIEKEGDWCFVDDKRKPGSEESGTEVSEAPRTISARR